jgi:hypothetical protein
LDPSGLPIPDSAVSAPDSGVPQGQDLPYAPTPALPSSQDAGNAPGGDQGFDAQSVQNDPVYAFLSGAGKTSKELFDKYRSTAADANPDASDAELNALAIHGMPNQKMQWGGAQYLRSEADHQANTTRALLTNPKGDTIDGDKVADGITKMLANVPTGETVEAKYVENGLYQVTVTPPGDNKPPQVYTLNQNQVHDLANIGKAGQFDTLYEKGIGASLAALSQAEGTPVPGKAKPEADPTVAYNGIKGRYTQSEIAAMKERNKNQFGVPLVGDAKANVDYLESQRKARLEPEQKLEQAKAGFDAKKEIAATRDTTVRRGQDIRGEGTSARTAALIDNAHTTAGARALADAVAELRTREGTGGQLSPDDVALQSYIRQTGMGQGQAAPAAAPAAPLTHGKNAEGTAALGKRFQPGQTVYDKKTGQAHIVGQ